MTFDNDNGFGSRRLSVVDFGLDFDHSRRTVDCHDESRRSLAFDDGDCVLDLVFDDDDDEFVAGHPFAVDFGLVYLHSYRTVDRVDESRQSLTLDDGDRVLDFAFSSSFSGHLFPHHSFFSDHLFAVYSQKSVQCNEDS